MKTLNCRPVVTGDFIQPPMCENWGVAEFDAHFDMLKEAGIDTFILQWSGEMERGGIKTIHHKSSQLAQDTTHHLSEYKEYPDMLGNLLESAEKKQMQVFIGLPMITRQEWWELHFKKKSGEIFTAITPQLLQERFMRFTTNDIKQILPVSTGARKCIPTKMGLRNFGHSC